MPISFGVDPLVAVAAIVADRSATPAWVAADLLSQAEHDEQAQPILLTHV